VVGARGVSTRTVEILATHPDNSPDTVTGIPLLSARLAQRSSIRRSPRASMHDVCKMERSYIDYIGRRKEGPPAGNKTRCNLGSGPRPASRRTRPTDTETRCPGKGQRVAISRERRVAISQGRSPKAPEGLDRHRHEGQGGGYLPIRTPLGGVPGSGRIPA
jgi:hypothetical protein